MKFKYLCLLIVSPLVFLLDQLTKYIIVENLAMGEGVPVISGFFDIVHYTNSGAAFGLFAGNSPYRTYFFYAVSVAALVIIIFYITKLAASEKMVAFAFSLVVGGIFGNGMDRVRFQEVTDFLSFHIGDRSLLGVHLEWPAFNVADSAITIAMVLLILSAFRKSS